MKVSLNMASSIDGKIATSARGPVKLGTSYDSLRMEQIRAEHDAVINGASTFKAHPFPLHVKNKTLINKRLRQGKPAQPISAIVSSDLKIPRGTPWENSLCERWVFCGKNAGARRILRLRNKGVRVVQCSGVRPSATEILHAFSLAGCQSVLLEGGGQFNATFLELNLVDKIYLTLTPWLIGGADAPTFFEGKSVNPFLKLKLKVCKRVGQELYLEYARTKGLLKRRKKG